MRIKDKRILSANFHFWPLCNYHCLYCFNRFPCNTDFPSKANCLRIIKQLQEYGVEKINLVGGEPTLSPFLGELLFFAKDLGMTTSFITNGSKLSQTFLSHYRKSIDWIGLSIDSGNDEIHERIGRGNVQKLIEKCLLVKSESIKLKVNTVINKLNWDEDMTELMAKISPERWKVFQILIIQGQNDLEAKSLVISKREFDYFVELHANLNPIIENRDTMIESYVMIDHLGRFYQNSSNIYSYSSSILDIGIEKAFKNIKFSPLKFVNRGGLYQW